MKVRVGDKLKRTREHMLLTQFEVAVRAGVAPGSVFNAERGQPIRLSTARRIAKALNVELKKLVNAA